MSRGGERLPVTERLFSRFTAMSGWAAGDLRTPRDGGKPRGCSSPLGVAKAILFLLRTDPAAAIASRTCVACGATYRSELSARCEHCGIERPVAWGDWRLASVTPVPEPAVTD